MTNTEFAIAFAKRLIANGYSANVAGLTACTKIKNVDTAAVRSAVGTV